MTKRDFRHQEMAPREENAREEIASRVPGYPGVERPYAGLAPQTTAYSFFTPDGRPLRPQLVQGSHSTPVPSAAQERARGPARDPGL